MAKGDYWSESQRQAWQYVISGQESGLDEVEALTGYRAGGGAIRTTYWVELWHRAENAAAQWDTLYKLKGSDTVPESMFAETGFYYRQKYIATFSVNIRDELTGKIASVFRTVESDKRMTMDEWKAGLAEAAREDTSDIYGDVLEINNIEFYENMNL